MIRSFREEVREAEERVAERPTFDASSIDQAHEAIIKLNNSMMLKVLQLARVGSIS